MRVITGDECGLLKEVIPNSVSYTHEEAAPISSRVQAITPLEQQSRNRGIVALTKLQSGERGIAELNYSFAALLHNGTVETYQGQGPSLCQRKKKSAAPSFFNFSQKQVIKDLFKNFDSASNPASPLHPVGIGCCHDAGGKTLLAACTSRGDVSVIGSSGEHQFKVEAQYDTAVVSNYENQNREKRSIAKHPPCFITAFAVNNTTSTADLQCAVAGREKETVVLDLQTGQVIWKAKNVKDNLQTLLSYPIWGTAMQFLPYNSTTSNLLAVGTAYKQVRIYDLRSETRRPVLMSPLDPMKGLRDGEDATVPYRVTSLCTLGGSHFIGAGDAAGYAYSLDIRNLKHVMGRYRGPCGSIRGMSAALEAHENPQDGEKHKGTLAMVGLDRYLRTFNVASRKSLDSIYLKQRLNCCLTFDEPPFYNKQEIEEDEDDAPEADFSGAIDDEDHVKDIKFGSDSDNEGPGSGSGDDSSDEAEEIENKNPSGNNDDFHSGTSDDDDDKDEVGLDDEDEDDEDTDDEDDGYELTEDIKRKAIKTENHQKKRRKA